MSARRLLGSKGGRLIALDPKTGKAKAEIEIIVLRKRTVKLAICPVYQPDGELHCKTIPVARLLVAKMNAIWTPQANVEITLASNSSVKAMIRLPPYVDPDGYTEMFKGMRMINAEFTMFVLWGLKGPSGRAFAEKGFALIPQINTMDIARTMAHELCHLLDGDSKTDEHAMRSSLCKTGGGSKDTNLIPGEAVRFNKGTKRS